MILKKNHYLKDDAIPTIFGTLSSPHVIDGRYGTAQNTSCDTHVLDILCVFPLVKNWEYNLSEDNEAHTRHSNLKL